MADEVIDEVVELLEDGMVLVGTIVREKIVHGKNDLRSKPLRELQKPEIKGELPSDHGKVLDMNDVRP